MKVLVSRAAAARIFAEIQRWVEQGLREHGVPLESLVYPLSALLPLDGLRTPLELLELDQIHQLVVDSAAIPPDSVKDFSPANCHFSPDDPSEANRLFNREIDGLLDSHPRLAVNSKLHSHPFSGRPFLSGGDLYHGVKSPAALQWRQRRGLNTAVLHVGYPHEGEPRISERPWRLKAEGAVCASKTCWRIRTWASDSAGEMHDLGDAQVVSNRHPSVRVARRLPYWKTKQGGKWCDRQKAALRLGGFEVSRNLMGRGWRRYLLQGRGRHLLFALPPDLPAAPIRVLQVHDAMSNRFEALPLPDWAEASPLSGLSLKKLARHYAG